MKNDIILDDPVIMENSVLVWNRIFQLDDVIELDKEWIFKTNEIKCIKRSENANQPYELHVGKSCFCVLKESYKKNEWGKAVQDCLSRKNEQGLNNNFYGENYYFQDKPKDYKNYMVKYPSQKFSIEKKYSKQMDMFMYICVTRDIRPTKFIMRSMRVHEGSVSLNATIYKYSSKEFLEDLKKQK